MLKNINITLLTVCLLITACSPQQSSPSTATPSPAAESIKTSNGEVIPPAPALNATPTSVPQEIEQPLSKLKGRLVKENQDYILLLGIGPVTNPESNYQFTESYQYPHERIKQDFKLMDADGKDIPFEELDPNEFNLTYEEPLENGVTDPRVFRFAQANLKGPVTLEVVNMVKSVTLAEPLPEKIELDFDAGFPMSKQQWEIQKTVEIIPGAPFTIKYYQPIGFNDKPLCNEGVKNFFKGIFYLEAPGYEYLGFKQMVPPERENEFSSCGGGGGDTICSDYENCLVADTDMITTNDSRYVLQVNAYNQIIHGPWKVSFDLPN